MFSHVFSFVFAHSVIYLFNSFVTYSFIVLFPKQDILGFSGVILPSSHGSHKVDLGSLGGATAESFRGWSNHPGNSRAHILAAPAEPESLKTPPRNIKLRLLGEKYLLINRFRYSLIHPYIRFCSW